MSTTTHPYKKYVSAAALACAFFTFSSCEKYLENTALPAGTIAGTEAFVSDNAVSAIVTGNLLALPGSGAFSGGTASNVAYLTSLYTDELRTIATSNTTAVAFYTNSITAANTSHWSNLYSKIYAINAAIEGIQSTTATLYNKNQWLGESYFLRALAYFYLVNLYGDAPLALTTDYQVNGKLPRAPKADVYQQIIKDLKEAQSLLSDDYKDGYGSVATTRVRPNKGTATALLAKAYLYAKDWQNAETEASAVLSNTRYKLSSLAQAFIGDNGTNKETIWAIANKNEERVLEYGFYNNAMPASITKDPATTYGVLVAMSDTLAKSFEANDGRFANWVRYTEYINGATTLKYYFPNKYKSNAVGGERTIFMRMAEVFLIRAEARARRSNFTGAASDIDSVRLRAGLPVTTATTEATLLAAIAQERKVELFTEMSNRFFDLKRTETIDAHMANIAPLKGGKWSSYMQVWPIPPADIRINPAIVPNTGY